MSEILSNYEAVRARLAAAEKAAGREPGSVTLVAVTKTFEEEAIRPLLEAGHRVFGENRVQEAQAKWPALKAEFPDVELHLIGPLQSNKADDAVRLFDVIQSVDRAKIVQALQLSAQKSERLPDIFVQINTGAEAQKAGALPEDADALISLARGQPWTRLAGLMCIPPFGENPAPHFALLEKIAQRNRLQNLSMGMSGDFESAIGFGATHVRVGSAILGER